MAKSFQKFWLEYFWFVTIFWLSVSSSYSVWSNSVLVYLVTKSMAYEVLRYSGNHLLFGKTLFKTEKCICFKDSDQFWMKMENRWSNTNIFVVGLYRVLCNCLWVSWWKCNAMKTFYHIYDDTVNCDLFLYCQCMHVCVRLFQQ